MTVHSDMLELAAAAIDFQLDPAERTILEAHLAACTACRRAALALDHDARAIRGLPDLELSPERAQRIWHRIDEPRRIAVAPLRLLALAALLALLAVSAVSVASTLLDRDRLSRLDTPPPSVDAAPRPTTLGTVVVATPVASEAPPGFAADTILEILVSDLRVRTAPTVDDAVSAKLEPTLGEGTRLKVVEGPVRADGYEWYLVEAVGWPHRGWVAVADHDGEPWVDDPALRNEPRVALNGDQQVLLGGLRADAAVACGPRVAGLPGPALAGIECRLNTALVVRVGAYLFEDEGAATIAYLERLQSTGVTLGSGDCARGTIGDDAWASGGSARDLVPFGGAVWAPQRLGCFRDQYGAANVRATCGRAYVGILGRNEDLAALHAWAREPAGAGGEPGICSASAFE